MYFDERERLLNELIKLPEIALNDLIIGLFEKDKLDYVKFSRFYVDKLERDNNNKTTSVNSLGLMLGMYCMADTSITGKTARRHLYESEMYGHNDGSKFGEILDKEFNNK